MKKIKTLAVSAMVLAMGSMVFANPKSNTKKATVDLFEDGVVDSLKTGVEDNKGFAAVGYGSKAFNAAAGAWLADTFWFGLAYDNKNNLAEQWNNSTAFDYSNSKGTAGEVVDTTTTKTDKVGKPGYWDPTANGGQGAWVNTSFANNAETYNNVSVNIGVKGIGGEIYWNNDYAGKKDDSNTVTDTQSTATKTEESSKSTTNTKNNNTWGINFAGLKTAESGDLAFYLGLDNVEFTLNNAGTVQSASKKITKHGDVTGVNEELTPAAGGNPAVTGSEKYTSSTNYTTQKIGGKVAGSLGFTLPEFGIVTPKFEFADEISGYYNGKATSSSSKTVNTALTTKTTVEKSTSTNYGADFNLANVATPAMKFTFDAGENVKIAAKVKAPVTFDYTRDGADFSTSRTITTTEALDKSTKTVTNAYTESKVNGKDVNKYTVQVVPEVDLGIVWAIMPGKLNFNFGVAATAGDFKWVTTNSTTSKKTLNSKTVYTDEFGVETVTADSKSLLAEVDANGNNSDTSVCDYTVTSANVKGNIGATLFLGEYATLDMLIANTVDNYGLGNFFQNWNFDIMFSVKF